MTDTTDLRTQFLRQVERRIEQGAAAYGDLSFQRPTLETAEQVLEEIEDIAGWAFVMWVQARQRLAAAAEAIDELREKP